jgi:hypothetical protein
MIDDSQYGLCLTNLTPPGSEQPYLSGAVPAFPPLRFINKSGFLTRPKLNDYTVTREELLSRANDIYGWIDSGDLKVAVGELPHRGGGRGGQFSPLFPRCVSIHPLPSIPRSGTHQSGSGSGKRCCQ